MACATVIEEMLPIMPPGMQHQVFDFGWHVKPEKLRRTLQAAIDAIDSQQEIRYERFTRVEGSHEL